MYNALKRLTSLAAAAAVMGASLPSGSVLCAKADSPYTVKMLKTYLYSMDNTAETKCLFTDEMPELPYIRPADFMSRAHTVAAQCIRNDDGTYTVSNENGSMVIDPSADTIFFDNFEHFMFEDPFNEGSELESDYLVELPLTVDDPKPVTLDFSEYGIDIIEADGEVYLPLTTMNDLENNTYNYAAYQDGELYFEHAFSMATGSGYFDRSPVYQQMERSQAIADFTYRELCFVTDKLYGAPLKAEFAPLIEEQGLDKTLDTYSDESRLAKELLLSTSRSDQAIGMSMLSDEFDDGGHTVMYVDYNNSGMLYPECELLNDWLIRLTAPQTDAENMARDSVINTLLKNEKMLETNEQKNNAFQNIELVNSWNDGQICYAVDGDTAVFSFVQFFNDVIEPFKWSLDHAKEHGVKNFIIDISANTGGSTAVLSYMTAILENSVGTPDDRTNIRMLSTVTGSYVTQDIDIDLDLDGDFDDDDKNVVYDFNFGVVTSKMSFSCANLMAVMAKDMGICLLGEQSGGGSCTLAIFSDPLGGFYCMSGSKKLVSADNTDADFGAAVDHELAEKTMVDGTEVTDYSKLYDIASLGEMVREFYAAKFPESSAPAISSSSAGENRSESENQAGSSQADPSSRATANTTANPSTGNAPAAFAAMSLLSAIAVVTKKKS